MITIALPKGALLKDSISTFKKAGLDFSNALEENNRSLTFESNCKRAKALLVRNGDVPVYVSYGQVKKNSNYSKPTDLPANCKVASKFIKTARSYFEELNIPVEIVHLTGSVELGPITGMAEAIVDLVATGKTLKENGLIKIDDLYYSTARLIGNPLSMRLDDNHLRDTILSIESTNAL